MSYETEVHGLPEDGKEGYKTCTKCGQSKPLDGFYAHPRGTYGVMSVCKECHKAGMGERYRADSEPKRAYMRSQYAALSPLGQLIWSAKKATINRKAKGRQMAECELTVEDLFELYEEQQGRCWWTGIPLVIKDRPANPLLKVSLDRIDSSVGYVRGNVVLTVYAANLMRNSATYEETLEFLEKLQDHADRAPVYDVEASLG